MALTDLQRTLCRLLAGLVTGDAKAAAEALARGELRFHTGRIKGAFPRIIPQ